MIGLDERNQTRTQKQGKHKANTRHSKTVGDRKQCRGWCSHVQRPEFIPPQSISSSTCACFLAFQSQEGYPVYTKQIGSKDYISYHISPHLISNHIISWSYYTIPYHAHIYCPRLYIYICLYPTKNLPAMIVVNSVATALPSSRIKAQWTCSKVLRSLPSQDLQASWRIPCHDLGMTINWWLLTAIRSLVLVVAKECKGCVLWRILSPMIVNGQRGILYPYQYMSVQSRS